MAPKKLPDKSRWSDVRKQRIRPKIIWPIAPDGYIPNSVVRSLAPYPKFSRSNYCANRGLQVTAKVEEDKTLNWKEQLKFLLMKIPSKEEEQKNEDHMVGLEHGIQRVNLRQYFLQNKQKFLQENEELQTNTSSAQKLQKNLSSAQKLQTNLSSVEKPQKNTLSLEEFQTNAFSLEELQANASSVEELQTNAPSVEKLQTNSSSVEDLQTNASSVEDLQTNASSVEDLQTNTSSVEELKNEEDDDFIHPPKMVSQSNACAANQTKKKEKGQKLNFKLPEGLSTRLQQEKDELQQEITSSIKEQKKSFQDGIDRNGYVPQIGDLNQNMRQKINFSSKKLKTFVSPPHLMGDRRPDSVLMYLYKRSKAESLASDGVKHSKRVLNHN